MGAALSDGFLAPIDDIKLLWSYAKPFYKRGNFYAYHYEVAIALADDVEGLHYFLNRNIDISHIWKSVIDFNAIACAKFLVKHSYGRSVIYQDERVSIADYAKLAGSKKMLRIVAKL